MYRILGKDIIGITTDSRRVKPGYAFFAVSGANEHGSKYIQAALDNGATLVVTDRVNPEIGDDRVVLVEDGFYSMKDCLDMIYPYCPRHMIAVTGTNGKSSIVSYFQQITALCNRNSLCIGTLGLQSNVNAFLEKFVNKKKLTTYDLISNRQILNEATKHKIDYCALEASSHGLHQKRLYGIKFNCAIFTNITTDHLDYHQTFENYENAKFDLINYLNPEGCIITTTDLFHKYQNRFDGQNIITIGKSNSAVNYHIDSESLSGQIISLEYRQHKIQFHTKLLGHFQVLNLVMAIIAAHESGVALDNITKIIDKVESVDGRFQHLSHKDRHVFIDYAHTEDGLKTMLSELVKLKTDGTKLHVLFGCGGERDNRRRSGMGRIAHAFADHVIITDDNPRNEDPNLIRQEIMSYCPNATEIADREEAIKYCISFLNKGDILLIAGKGHENYQIMGNQSFYFSDKEFATKYLFQL